LHVEARRREFGRCDDRGDCRCLSAAGGEVAETIRAAAHDIKPGITSDEGEGDAWPALRQRILAADVLLLATPIWLGQPSGAAKRVMERTDASLDEVDDQGRMPSYSELAVCAVVGNEDGAHAVSAQISPNF